MSEFVIAEVITKDIDDGEIVEPTFYKVFLKDPSGSLWFEMEFNDKESAEKYVKISEKYPSKTSLERAIMVEKGEL